MIIYKTFDDIWAEVLAFEIPEEYLNYEWYAITQSGLTLAHMFAIKYQKRIKIVDPKLRLFTPRDASHSPILFFDDCITLGTQFNIVTSLMELTKNEYKLFCYYHNPLFIKPDLYILKTNDFMMLPWEAYKPQANMGYDLDGTIYPPSKNTFLSRLLGWIYWAIWEKFHPPLVHPKGPFIIITGRNVSDRSYTEKWLDKHNIHPTKLIMAPTNFYKTKADIAKWKTQQIIANKIIVYAEDDQEIAECIKNELGKLHSWTQETEGVYIIGLDYNKLMHK